VTTGERGESSIGASGAALAWRRLTPRVAWCQSARSSLLGLRIVDQHDMQAARPVCAKNEALLDVAGA